MAVPKWKKCKSKACIRLNYLKYKKTILSKYINTTINFTVKNNLNFFKKQKCYLI